MLKDFEMICHHFPKNEDITILPVSDVHLGAAEHMQRAWELFCQSVLEGIRLKVRFPLWKEIDEILERYMDWMRFEEQIYWMIRNGGAQ